MRVSAWYIWDALSESSHSALTCSTIAILGGSYFAGGLRYDAILDSLESGMDGRDDFLTAHAVEGWEDLAL